MWKKPKPLFTLREAMTHILVTGRPGAGKTSAFLKRIQLELLKQGAYCMHCCVKPDEADRAAKLMPRAIRFSPSSGHVFNPLTYTMARKGARHLASFHDELGDMLTRSDSQNTDSYWKAGQTDAQMAAFELSWLTRGEQATYSHCRDILLDSPINPEHAGSDAFRHNRCGQALEQALTMDKAKAMPIVDYFMKRLAVVGDKARGAIINGALTSIEPFCVPPLTHALNGKSTLTPHQMVNGFTILDFDTLTYGMNGLAYISICSWFAMEEVLARKKWKRPFLLVRDEYPQLAQSRRDVQALSVGRSQGLISLAALQTLPGLEDSLGAGLEAQTQAKALMGLHVNKIYCNNNCHVTNEYASMSIGQERRIFFGGNHTPDPDNAAWYDVLGVGQRPSFSFNQQFHYRVEPHVFTSLRTGGKENNLIVDGILTRGTPDFEFHSLKQR